MLTGEFLQRRPWRTEFLLLTVRIIEKAHHLTDTSSGSRPSRAAISAAGTVELCRAK